MSSQAPTNESRATRALRRCALDLIFFTCRRDRAAASSTIVVKGTFELQSGQPARMVDWKERMLFSGDAFYDDDPRSTLRYPSDLAPFKPRADVLVVGTAYPPPNASASRVEMKVGRLSKSLVVVGDRRWTSGLMGLNPSDASKLPKLQLRYEHAFGGEGFAPNPVGKGFCPPTEERKAETVLPNIEHPDELIRNAQDVTSPAGFGPLDCRWAARRSKAGTYDEVWLRERWPWFPADFDWSYFNAAPADQQLPYLHGDETIVLEGMHTKTPKLESQLPGVRPRCFARRRTGSLGPQHQEVPLALDTVWIDADVNRMTLVWRGCVALESMKSRELEAILLVQESLSEEPAPAEQFQAESYWQDAPKTEEQLADEEEMAEQIEVEPERDQSEREAAALAEARQMLVDNHVSPELIEKLSKVSSIDAFLGILEQEKPKPDEAELKQATQQAHADGQATVREHGKDPQAFEDPAKAAPPPAREGQERLTRQQVVERAVAKHGLSNVDLSELDLSGLDLREQSFELSNLKGANLASSKLDRADLSRASLRGAKLRAASLQDAVLEEADLEGADLEAANLDRANVAGANLAGARLVNASCRLADLSSSNLTAADLTYATLVDCQLDKAVLRAAKLNGTKAQRALLRESDLTDADLGGAGLDVANLTGAILDAARLDGTSLVGAVLQGARGKDVSFKEADLSAVRASGALLPGARCSGCKADASIWVGAVLDGARFEGASLVRADLSGAGLELSIFHLAVMKQVNLSHSRLTGAKLTKVNCFQARLEGADMSMVDARGSNFFGSDFQDTIVQGALFERSNLKRTRLEKPASITTPAGAVR